MEPNTSPVIPAHTHPEASARGRQLHFILILYDDMGYGDIELNGGSIPTPAIHRMAQGSLVGGCMRLAYRPTRPRWLGQS